MQSMTQTLSKLLSNLLVNSSPRPVRSEMTFFTHAPPQSTEGLGSIDGSSAILGAPMSPFQSQTTG